MNDKSFSLEALKLIADWAKWLITIETVAIGAIAVGIKESAASGFSMAKLLSTAAIVSFVISIAAAALLLLSLPEIAQNINPSTNIWLTQDSIIGRVFGLNTQGFAVIESFFFGSGVILIAIGTIAKIWSPNFKF